jgi:hypothetical protein
MSTVKSLIENRKTMATSSENVRMASKRSRVRHSIDKSFAAITRV